MREMRRPVAFLIAAAALAIAAACGNDPEIVEVPVEVTVEVPVEVVREVEVLVTPTPVAITLPREHKQIRPRYSTS